MAFVIGIPKEHRPFEYRVGMIPVGVAAMTAAGHQCYVESGAGAGSGFTDREYEQAGARIAYGPDEVFRRAELIVKVHRPTKEESDWLAGNQTVLSFMMLSAARQDFVKDMEEKNITAIAYELIEDDDGKLPVLFPLSQIGGRMTAQIAAQYLQNDKGGKGLLLGGIAGVPPADVVIIGAGVVGMNATQAFLGMGARVILLDNDAQKLQIAHERYNGQITTMISHDFNLRRVCKFADVLVGAVQVPRQRTPQLITREMVRSMRPGSLIIDMDIDQGGCVETSRPTQHDRPTYVEENVIHYCVPNVPGVVGRTSTHAFLNASWPFVKMIAEHGLESSLKQSAALRRGVAIAGKAVATAVS